MTTKPEKINAAIDHAMKTVGLESLKREQREAIQEFLSGKDVFVSLPTGYGKTYCYSLLPLAFDYLRESQHPSIVICVSPLTALMMEQRAKMSTKGVASEFVGELQQDVDALQGVKGNSSCCTSAPNHCCVTHSGESCCCRRSTARILWLLW